MGIQNSNCAILADRNAETSEGIRGLLESEFESVYLVANLPSLTRGIENLRPQVVVLDQFVGPEAIQEILQSVRALAPEFRLIVLVLYENSQIAESLLAAGADAVVLKRRAGTDLFEALVAMENGIRYVSPGFRAVAL